MCLEMLLGRPAAVAVSLDHTVYSDVSTTRNEFGVGSVDEIVCSCMVKSEK